VIGQKMQVTNHIYLSTIKQKLLIRVFAITPEFYCWFSLFKFLIFLQFVWKNQQKVQKPRKFSFCNFEFEAHALLWSGPVDDLVKRTSRPDSDPQAGKPLPFSVLRIVW